MLRLQPQECYACVTWQELVLPGVAYKPFEEAPRGRRCEKVGACVLVRGEGTRHALMVLYFFKG